MSGQHTSQNLKKFYSGESGDKYFGEKFDGRMSLGRQFQAEYFLPHCSDDLVLVDFGCGDGTTLRRLPAKEKIWCRNQSSLSRENQKPKRELPGSDQDSN